jgi:hypothetical protein
MSYAGTMGFGFTMARCAVPDASELATALREAYDDLVAAFAAGRARAPAASRRRRGGP